MSSIVRGVRSVLGPVGGAVAARSAGRLAEPVAAGAVELAERGLPDGIVRAGMRASIGRRLAAEQARPERERDQWLWRWWNGPVALVPDDANRQHYEVPAEFFELILGPRLKYSSCLWETSGTLASAELAMLDRTIDQAGISNGMQVLDLGCGWGSISLRVAERFPDARVTAVSNSASQGAFITERARVGGLDGVSHRVIDVNDLADAGLSAEGRFDRIVSVEMLEHVRNHRRILSTVGDLLADDGAFYAHVFAHRERFWPFEDEGSANWMTRFFFAGGVMPSTDLLTRAVDPSSTVDGGPEPTLVPDESWWYSGRHYARTLDAWLDRIDANRDEVERILTPVYGPDTDRWIQRWRMFMMACSELFGYADGTEWGVVHHRFLKQNLG